MTSPPTKFYSAFGGTQRIPESGSKAAGEVARRTNIGFLRTLRHCRKFVQNVLSDEGYNNGVIDVIYSRNNKFISFGDAENRIILI